MQRAYSFKGFTLIELLCAVGLTGVLSAGLVVLVARTLEAQLRVQETFLAKQEVARGFAWLARDVETAWLPPTGEAWFVREGAVCHSLYFCHWSGSGWEGVIYHVRDEQLLRGVIALNKDMEPPGVGATKAIIRESQVCRSVTSLSAEPCSHGVKITLVLTDKKQGEQEFSRVFAPLSQG